VNTILAIRLVDIMPTKTLHTAMPVAFKTFMVSFRLSTVLTALGCARMSQLEPPLRLLPCGELVAFEAGKGTHDWDYPWDLCGTLYRASTVRSVLRRLRSAEPDSAIHPPSLRHPNALEAAGQSAFRAVFAEMQAREEGAWLRSALARRAMVVVTINRVQVPTAHRLLPARALSSPRLPNADPTPA
jgi:hypothetical protein